MAVTCLFPEFSQASFYGQAPLERGKPRDVVLLDVRVAESRGMTYARLNIPFPSSVSHQRRWNRGGSNGVPLLPACTGAHQAPQRTITVRYGGWHTPLLQTPAPCDFGQG